jgi:hypothetical protein
VAAWAYINVEGFKESNERDFGAHVAASRAQCAHKLVDVDCQHVTRIRLPRRRKVEELKHVGDGTTRRAKVRAQLLA